jgi:hypothetical protein
LNHLNKIERLIAGIIQAEMNYEKEMEEWESNGELEILVEMKMKMTLL